MRKIGQIIVLAALASCSSVQPAPTSSSTPTPPATQPPPPPPAASTSSVQLPPGVPAPTPEEIEADRVEEHNRALLDWIEQSQARCGSTKDLEAYLPRREGMSNDDEALVKKRCAEAIEVTLRGSAWTASLRACVDRYVQANGARKQACRLAQRDVPDVPPSIFEIHAAACSAACAVAGPDAIELKKERSKPAMCCDGTPSPTCTYARLGPNCCAGHRGVCIE